MSEGSYYFNRLKAEAKKISPHIRFRRIKFGFYRIYYKNAYIGECSKDMTQKGYDINMKNWNVEDYSFYDEYHDTMEQTAKVKNFREGYWETLDMLKTRIFMFRHNKEMYEKARQGYAQVRVK